MQGPFSVFLFPLYLIVQLLQHISLTPKFFPLNFQPLHKFWNNYLHPFEVLKFLKCACCIPFPYL